MEMTSDKMAARLIAAALRHYPTGGVVLCPGSRNAPLNTAIHAESGRHVRIATAVDERAGAFMALGMALASGKPSVMVCTSGSALLDAAPAVAEAYYRRVPLIIVSADRPARWIDQDDSQTIRQPGALGSVVGRTIDIPVETAENISYLSRLICDAFTSATDTPVHLNIQIDAPLGGEIPAGMPLPQFRPVGRLIPRPGADALLSDPFIAPLLADLAASERPMIYIGGLNQAFTGMESLEQSLRRLSESGVEVVAEFQSGIHGAYAVPSAQWQARQVSALVTLGGAPVSQAFKQYVRSNPPRQLVRVSATDRDGLVDTYGALTHAVGAIPEAFCEAWARVVHGAGTPIYYNECPTAIEQSAAIIEAVIGECRNCDIHIGNGMAIRYAQRCRVPEGARVMANRGVSGIDGCTSTAFGSAYVSGRPTVLITGDMSWHYDLAALSLPRPATPLRIVVLNNGGGDIFRRVAATSHRLAREQLFCRPGGTVPTVGELCHAWRLPWSQASDIAGVAREMAYIPDGVSVLEVSVDYIS